MNKKYALSHNDLINIQDKLSNGEMVKDIADSLGIYRPSFATILRRYNIRKPEKVKLITTQIRAQTKARYIDDSAALNGNCEKCGKDKQLIRHHPDYNDCYLIEYICRKCHANEHKNSKRKYTKPNRQQSAIMLNKIMSKYGPQKTALLINFNNFTISASEISRKFGLSRERVRQYLIHLHGKSTKGGLKGNGD